VSVDALRLARTTSADPAFRGLVRLLDAELRATYGAVQSLYEEHNLVDAIGTAIVVYAGDAPVGCGCFRAYGRDAVELKRMFVALGHRGLRVGAVIVDALETWAKERGARRVVLETGTLQHAAMRMYARSGYEVIPNFGPYATLPASVCMAKSIA
jgi:GNAT superfamily N-acetyltransferase